MLIPSSKLAFCIRIHVRPIDWILCGDAVFQTYLCYLWKEAATEFWKKDSLNMSLPNLVTTWTYDPRQRAAKEPCRWFWLKTKTSAGTSQRVTRVIPKGLPKGPSLTHQHSLKMWWNQNALRMPWELQNASEASIQNCGWSSSWILPPSATTYFPGWSVPLVIFRSLWSMSWYHPKEDWLIQFFVELRIHFICLTKFLIWPSLRTDGGYVQRF